MAKANCYSAELIPMRLMGGGLENLRYNYYG